VTSQAAVELKPHESEQPGHARLVAMRALQRGDDGPALQLPPGAGAGARRHRFRVNAAAAASVPRLCE
jgi:hypothetical protein